MMSRQNKILSAAVGALALIATAAGARPLHPHASDPQPPASQRQTTPAAPATTGSAAVDSPRRTASSFQLRGIIGCGAAAPGLDCGKLEKLLAE